MTGFLGPNGAGKTTTLRMLLGLVRPSAGRATIGGLAYDELSESLTVVGAGLDGSSFHPGRTGRNHLRWVASTHDVPTGRCDELLEMTGLSAAANRRVGGYSMGMRQRPALAGALLGDPHVVMLDEPANGLDPEGIAWLRTFLRHLASQGRTVLVSSHVLSEVQQTVDDVVIIARGRLVRSGPLSELGGVPGIEVRSPDSRALMSALTAAGLTPTASQRDDATSLLEQTWLVEQVDAARIGAIAHAAGIELHHLAPADTDLEQAFLRLVTETGETPR